MLQLLTGFWSRITDLFRTNSDIEYNRIEPMIGLTLVHDAFNVNTSNILVPANICVAELYCWVAKSLNILPDDIRLFRGRDLLDSGCKTKISDLAIEDGMRLACILRNSRHYY